MAPDPDPVEAWQRFCDELAAAGARVGADPFPADERAACLRHLGRQVVMGLQTALEHADPAAPTFHRYEEPWVQWGGPNPDNVYLRAAVDPTATYRVTGDVRGVRAALLSLVEGDMHLDEYGVWGECALSDLAVGDDGTVEVWVSPDPHDGNWIEAHPDARHLLVRQYLCDWERDRAATFTIERVGGEGVPAAAPTAASVAAGLDHAARWVARSVDYWCAYVERARTHLPHNEVSAPSAPKGGAPTIGYGAGWWSLHDEEVLLVTVEQPDADYWGWSLHHRYRLDSGDFAGRQTSLNAAQAQVDADGRVRLVLSPRDPGVPNWLDTEGRTEGMAVYRSIGTRSRPVPRAAVVPLAQLRDHLPPTHPTVTPEQRRAQLARRRAAVLARYG